MLVALVVFLVGVLLVLPFVISQVTTAIEAAPGVFEMVREVILARFPDIMAEDSALRTSLSAAQGRLQELGLGLTKTLLSSSLAIIDIAGCQVDAK